LPLNPQKNTKEQLVDQNLVYAINACVFEVYRRLGHGFLEKVYENALAIELAGQGLTVAKQIPFSVQYKGENVGEYSADLLVGDKIIIEVKAVERIHPAHEAQILNYLKATGRKLGLLVNFSHPKATVKRFVF